jgi:hypothetical protein
MGNVKLLIAIGSRCFDRLWRYKLLQAVANAVPVFN